jgi:hypothetical protein
MVKKIITLYLSICIGSFILAGILLYANIGNEKELYGNLFDQYQNAIYKGIAIMCVSIIPIFLISGYLLRFECTCSKSTPQQLKIHPLLSSVYLPACY